MTKASRSGEVRSAEREGGRREFLFILSDIKMHARAHFSTPN